MGLVAYCKTGYSKIRSDFGADKINVKTMWFAAILLGIINLWQTCQNTKPQIVYITNPTKEIIKPYIINRIDTIKLPQRCPHLRKIFKPKKVNFSNYELKIMGNKTYTTSCVIGLNGKEKCNLLKCE